MFFRLYLNIFVWGFNRIKLLLCDSTKINPYRDLLLFLNRNVSCFLLRISLTDAIIVNLFFSMILRVIFPIKNSCTCKKVVMVQSCKILRWKSSLFRQERVIASKKKKPNFIANVNHEFSFKIVTDCDK